MAKKRAKSGRRDNKSAAIRDYVKSHSGEGPTAIAAALNAAHGWNIKPAYVSMIKSKMVRGKRAGKRRMRAAAAAVGAGVSENALLQAKRLAEQLGGVQEAKAAVDLLSRLTG
jgi:hypothetical protein